MPILKRNEKVIFHENLNFCYSLTQIRENVDLLIPFHTESLKRFRDLDYELGLNN